MDYNVADLFATLDIMWKGMAGLFLVCIFIMLITMVMSKFMIHKDKNSE